MKIESKEIKNIKTLESFCKFFGISEIQLSYIRKHKEELYRVAYIGKRNGEYRIIYPIADDGYRNLLKALKETLDEHYLYDILPPPRSVHGFVKNRSIITNARCHLQKKILLNLDIKNFFESIKEDEISKIFTNAGFTKKHASILTELVTVDGRLATGFPTSPVIANLFCMQMDGVFELLCSKFDAVYTRYADDISISSNSSIPSKKTIAEVLEKYGFTINESKYKISRRGGNQYVTGLTVCGDRPRLSRRLKRSVRLELYYIKKYGFMNHLTRVGVFKASRFSRMIFEGFSVGGYISFIHSVEPELAKKMWWYLKNSPKDYVLGDGSKKNPRTE